MLLIIHVHVAECRSGAALLRWVLDLISFPLMLLDGCFEAYSDHSCQKIRLSENIHSSSIPMPARGMSMADVPLIGESAVGLTELNVHHPSSGPSPGPRKKSPCFHHRSYHHMILKSLVWCLPSTIQFQAHDMAHYPYQETRYWWSIIGFSVTSDYGLMSCNLYAARGFGRTSQYHTLPTITNHHRAS